MTSQINYDIIIETFPIAGEDNDSQGFRDNFAATKAGLYTAKNEITALQNNTVKTASLDTNSPVVNDMGGSTIYNGLHKDFNGVYHNAGLATGIITVDVAQGPLQRFTLTGNVVLNFNNWPEAGAVGLVRLMVIGNQAGTRTVNFSTANSGIIRAESGLNLPATIGQDGKYSVFEAWTFDAGTSVFIRFLGTY